MGSSNSHQQQADHTTPERRDCHARVLGLDPRSPTANINRTPIIVLKTPEEIIDPRSPTYGIIRTPIVLDKVIEQEGDPRSPTPGIVCTLSNIIPVSKLVGKKEIVEHTTLAQQSVTEVDSTVCSSMEMDIHVPVMNENSENFPDTINETCLQNLSLVESNEGARHVLSNPPLPSLSEKSSSNKENKAQRRKAQATQPKELFPKQRVSVSYKKDSTRSPLSTRTLDMNSPLSTRTLDMNSPLSTRTLDMNSPRQIVQWNQSKKVENARSCQMESVNSRFIANDKENNYFG